MRRGILVLVLGVVAATLGVASAQAAGSAPTTDATATTTTTTTTTGTTTTPSYAPLASSSLPAGCVGAGPAALVLPGHPVITLGTHTNLGPSAYPSSGSILAFGSASSSGAGCSAGTVTVSSVSLFGGVVTASSVQARDGRGTVSGLEVDGAAVAATAGATASVDGWGELMIGATIGRVTAPLVLRLYQAHGSLPAGTAVMVGFAASAQPLAKPNWKPKHYRHAPAHQQQTKANASGSHSHGTKHSGGTHHLNKHAQGQLRKRTPNFPAPQYPVLAGGTLPPEARDNAIVSLAMHYLGVPYLWGGASPKTGFDCSGLVKYVFGKLGVPLVHYAASQWHTPGSVWVAPNRLQPGDLVFFVGSDGTRKSPGHVGIYVDGGYMIDAPHTGSFVRIDRLSDPGFAKGYIGAKRIVGVPLHARHLRHLLDGPAKHAAASVPALPLILAPQVTNNRAPAGSLPLLDTDATAAHPSAQRDYALWTGIVLGGILLLVAPGTFAYRRRERGPQVVASPDAPS